MTSEPPNPGSVEAQEQGCTCAVMDNHYGRYAPYPPDGWWIAAGCPVHAPEPEPDPESIEC